MKIRILEQTGSFVPGIADVSEEVAARTVKSGLAEYITEGAKEEKAPEIPPVLSPENTGLIPPVGNEEPNTEGAKAPEVQTEVKE